MNVSVTFPRVTETPPGLYRVLTYNEMPAWLGYTTEFLPSQSNFGYVDVHIPGLGTGSITNFCKLSLQDIQKHRDMQHTNGKTINQIMTWLYGDVAAGGKPNRPYWADGGWRTTIGAKWGCILFTGNQVMIDKIQIMNVKEPNGPNKRPMLMGRVVPFTRADWGKTHASHPWLVHQASAEHWTGGKDVHNPTPGGAKMYSPLWSPVDFALKSGATERAYYAYMDTLTPA